VLECGVSTPLSFRIENGPRQKKAAMNRRTSKEHSAKRATTVVLRARQIRGGMLLCPPVGCLGCPPATAGPPPLGSPLLRRPGLGPLLHQLKAQLPRLALEGPHFPLLVRRLVLGPPLPGFLLPVLEHRVADPCQLLRHRR